MATIANLIKVRKEENDLTYDQFARMIHPEFIGSTLFRVVRADHPMSIETCRRLGEYAARVNDLQLLEALAQYALGVDSLAVTITKPT
jgi:hypothetical protein